MNQGEKGCSRAERDALRRKRDEQECSRGEGVKAAGADNYSSAAAAAAARLSGEGEVGRGGEAEGSGSRYERTIHMLPAARMVLIGNPN